MSWGGGIDKENGTVVIVLLFLLVWCCTFFSTLAIYEKDLGKRDLYFSNVGIVENSVFQISPLKKRVFVQTQQNVVASINLKNSKIGWRHVFEPDSPIDSIRPGPQGILALGRSSISLFSTEGSLLWEFFLQNKVSSSSSTATISKGWIDAILLPPSSAQPSSSKQTSEKSLVALLFNNTIQLRSSKDGSLLEMLTPSGDTTLYKLHHHNDILYAIGGQTSPSQGNEVTLVVMTIQLSTNPLSKHSETLQSFKIPRPTTQQEVPVCVNGYLLGLDINHEHLLMHRLGSLQQEMKSFGLSSFLSPSELSALLSPSIHLQYLEDDLYTLTSEKSKQQKEEFIHSSSSSPSSSSSSDEEFLYSPPSPTRTSLPFVLSSTDSSTQALLTVFLDTEAVIHSSVQLMKFIDNGSVSSVSYVSDKAMVVVVDGEGKVNVFDVSQKNILPSMSVLPSKGQVGGERGGHHHEHWKVKKLWLKSLPQKSEGTFLHQLLVSERDGTFSYLSFTTTSSFTTLSALSIKWNREEALSKVIQTDFVDFPGDSSMLEELAEEFSPVGSLTRVFVHFRIFFSHLYQTIISTPSTISLFYQYASKEDFSKALSSLMDEEEDNVDLRDRFGYRKMMVAVTEVGKLFGIHSKSGEIRWQRFYSDFRIKYFFQLKKSVSIPPESIVIGIDSQNQWWLSVINPLTGEETQLLSLPHSVSHAFQLPFTGHDHSSVILMMDGDGDGRVHYFPATPSSMEVINAHKPITYFFTHDGDTVTGYSILTQGTTVTAQVLWRKSWVGSPERVVSVLGSGVKMNAHGPARVLADNSVLWKYLNPNLIVIGTVSRNDASSSDGTGGGGGGRSDDEEAEETASTPSSGGGEESVSVYVMDGVTGRVVQRTQHKHATGPLHLAHAENWVVYHYWSTKSYCFEIGTIELYREPDWNAKFFSSYAEANTPVNVIQNSFIFTSSIATMSVTFTNKGITPKQILIGLSSGHVVALDKRVVDARRPIRHNNRPTMEDQIEGLMPYFPIVEPNPLLIINSNRTIPLLRSIYTYPTQLESTTLVTCLGLDLFYITLSGSTTYDRLDPNFNRPFLLFFMASILLLTMLVSQLAKRANLKQLWR